MPPTKILKYSSHDFNLISFHKTRDTYNDNSPIQRAMRFHLLNLVLGTNRKSVDSIYEYGAWRGEVKAIIIKSFDLHN